MIKLGALSKSRLKTVHPDLARVVEKCAMLSNLDFSVSCGARSLEDQRKAVMGGFSKTMHSRHLPGAHDKKAHAVDLVPLVGGKVPWSISNPKQKAHWTRLAAYMKDAAKAEGIHVEWGGDWKGFKDYPHFQLPWGEYPG
jgi:peptidoglycan L-alanyl-D-glutamate endopeptidase CwlK